MADVQSKVEEIPSLATRKQVFKVVADIAVTDTVDTVHTVAVVFDKAFVNIPNILGVQVINTASSKGVASVSGVTKVGMDVNLYQIAATDLATATHQVTVIYSGWKVS